jgi:hypothetical protein
MSGIDEVDGMASNRLEAWKDRNYLEGELDLCDFRIIDVTSNSEDLV